MGMGTDRYPLPWSMLNQDTRQEGYVVPLDKERLSDAPKHPSDEAPPYTAEYGRRVHQHYGIDD